MESLLARVPSPRRARDYHLYDRRGRRLLDLWLNDGRALLGHRPEGLQREMKEVLAKGTIAEFPSVYEERLRKALLGMVKGVWHAVLFQSRAEAEAAVGTHLGIAPDLLSIEDPFIVRPRPPGPAAYHRPFLEADYSGVEALFPVLPFPLASSPWPVLFRKPFAARPSRSGEGHCSPLLLAGMLKALHYLLKEGEAADIWKDWKLPLWRREGCYCRMEAVKDGGYEEVFDRFLRAGVLLPPDPESPIILPRRFSLGEKRLVERLCEETAARFEG